MTILSVLLASLLCLIIPVVLGVVAYVLVTNDQIDIGFGNQGE